MNNNVNRRINNDPQFPNGPYQQFPNMFNPNNEFNPHIQQTTNMNFPTLYPRFNPNNLITQLIKPGTRLLTKESSDHFDTNLIKYVEIADCIIFSLSTDVIEKGSNIHSSLQPLLNNYQQENDYFIFELFNHHNQSINALSAMNALYAINKGADPDNYKLIVTILNNSVCNPIRKTIVKFDLKLNNDQVDIYETLGCIVNLFNKCDRILFMELDQLVLQQLNLLSNTDLSNFTLSNPDIELTIYKTINIE